MGLCHSKDAVPSGTSGGGGTRAAAAAGGGAAAAATGPDSNATDHPTKFHVSDKLASAVETMGVSAQRTFGDLFKGGYSWSGAAAAAGTGGKGEEGSGDNASAGAGAAAAAGAGGTGIDSTARRLDEGFRRRVAEAKDGLARLAVVFAAPLELTHDFIAPVHAKTDEEKEFLLKCLGESFLFEELDRRERDTLVEAFEKKRVSKNESVITQGEVGDYFYVIESGKVKYVVDGKEVGKGGKGDTFGELALLYNSPRAATVVPLQPCELWRVDQLTFKRIIATYQLKEDAETKALLKEVDFLKDLDESALAKIAYLMGTKTYKAGEEIMHEGDPVTNFILIKKGKVRSSEYTAGGKRMEAMEFGVGKNFGSGLLMMGADAPVTVTAIEDTTLLYLGKSAFLKTCGDYESLIQKSADKRVLQMMSIHGKRNLAPSVVGHLASVLVNVKYSKGKVFYREGEAVTPGLYIVRTGEVTVECSEEEPKTVGPMGVFGEETVAEGSPKNEQLISKHTVTALTDIEIGYLGCSTIRKVLGPAEGEDELSKSVAEDGRPIQMDDLNRHRILGAGTFGQVWLVNRKGTKDAYALKIQFKRQLIDSNQAEGVIREKNIMAHLHSDFIIKLVATYQDAENAYMLMKLYQGGELWSVMHGGDGGLPELAARFYMASVLEGLTYMHRRSVIYRDLKPENVLLGSDGYTVIVDLGFAKIVPDKTYTFCGTPLYLAPEVILQRGHDKGADHWSWAVMLYEMICGITPFYDKDIDQMTLFKRIINERYTFPGDDFISPEARDLISSMLVADPFARLGGYARAEHDIQEHDWFTGFDFDKLANKELTPPWTPEITDPLDVSNFDNWDHLKDKKREGKPLTQEEQKLFEDF